MTGLVCKKSILTRIIYIFVMCLDVIFFLIKHKIESQLHTSFIIYNVMIGTIYIVMVEDKSYINWCLDYDQWRLFVEYNNNPFDYTGTLYTAIKNTYQFGLEKICDFKCNNLTELRDECQRLKDIFHPTLEAD